MLRMRHDEPWVLPSIFLLCFERSAVGDVTKQQRHVARATQARGSSTQHCALRRQTKTGVGTSRFYLFQAPEENFSKSLKKRNYWNFVPFGCKMPFYAKDWRSPGESWIKTEDGWEKLKVLETNRKRLISEDAGVFNRLVSSKKISQHFLRLFCCYDVYRTFLTHMTSAANDTTKANGETLGRDDCITMPKVNYVSCSFRVVDFVLFLFLQTWQK